MQISYCDLCGNVLEHGRHVVVVVHDKEFQAGLNQQRQVQDRTVYEICDSCLILVKDIFTYKKNKIKNLQDWLDKEYTLTPKKNKCIKSEKRKNG